MALMLDDADDCRAHSDASAAAPQSLALRPRRPGLATSRGLCSLIEQHAALQCDLQRDHCHAFLRSPVLLFLKGRHEDAVRGRIPCMPF